jgi:hypothetical protein
MTDNTKEQIAAHEAAEARAAEEMTWPIYQVVITGDTVEWVARPGVNDGQPWNAIAKATVTMHARNEDHAKALALNANSEYHTIESVTEIT